MHWTWYGWWFRKAVNQHWFIFWIGSVGSVVFFFHFRHSFFRSFLFSLSFFFHVWYIFRINLLVRPFCRRICQLNDCVTRVLYFGQSHHFTMNCYYFNAIEDWKKRNIFFFSLRNMHNAYSRQRVFRLPVLTVRDSNSTASNFSVVFSDL